jgi:TP901 family phage tail tape measure protein
MASNTETATAIIDVDGKMAGQKIEELTNRAKTLRKELKDMALKNDKAGWDRVRKEMEGVDKETKKIKASMYDLEKTLKNLNGSSIKDLERAQRSLRAEIKNTVAASAEEQAALKAKALQLEKVNQKLNQLRAEYNLAGTANRSFFSSMAEGMNKYFLAATSAIASFASIILGAKKAISTFAEWDDRLADVQKTTGLTREQVVKLNEEFKKIDTRSARLEMLDLARVAGKLGLSSETDVLGFVKAADKIKVALSEDLGGDVEESINQVGKLVDIFKIKEKFGIEDSMIKTGSAINALGAASTANEAYLVEFTKRVAGVAPTAGISISNILGLAATLDQLGQQSETSSTVFSTIIPDMFRNTANYARVAGMDVKDFSKLLKEDANEALLRMLEGMNGNNAGMEYMVKVLDDLGIEGKRSISVLGVLANNTRTLRDQQKLSNVEFDKGTSLINEFNTKNTTMQAKLEKARKSMYDQTVELGQRLAPALNFSTNSMTYMIKALNGLIKFFAEYKGVIIPTALAIGAYTVAVNASTIMTKLFDAATKIATTTMKLFNATTKMSPLAAMYAGVVALVSAFALYNRHVDDASAKLKELNKQTNSAVGESNALFEQLKKTTAGTNERREAIWRLRDVHGAYIDNLNLEKASLQEIEAAQKGANDELVRKITLESQTKDLAVWLTKELQIKKRIAELGFDVDKILKERANPQKDARGNIIFSTYGQEVDNLLTNLTVVEQEVGKINKLYENVTKSLSSLWSGGKAEGSAGDGGGNGNPLTDLTTKYELLSKQIEAAKKQLQEFAMTGNLSEILKTSKVLEDLTAAKEAVDYIVDANGNLEKAFDKIRQASIDAGIKDIKLYEPKDEDVSPKPIPLNLKPIETDIFGNIVYDQSKEDEKNDWYLEQVQVVTDAAFDIWRNASNARYEYEMNQLNSQMEKELSNKNLTEEQKDKIRAKYAAREKKLKQDQFRKQKTADIIQSLINTALAYVKALPNMPLAIAAGIAGAAQTAAIAAKPIPQFYQGGDTGKGLGFSDDKAPVAGVVHANEYVVPEWMRRIPQVIAFERVMEGIRTGRGYAGGGSTGTSRSEMTKIITSTPAVDNALNSTIDRLISVLERGVRGKWVLQDLDDIIAKKERIEKRAKL